MEGELQYARVGAADVGYRVLSGHGDRDVVFLLDAWFSMEMLYEDFVSALFLDGLRELGRLVVFDRIGIGVSDPTSAEEWTSEGTAEQLCAVIENAGLVDPIVVAEMFGSPAATIAANSSSGIGGLVLFEPYNPWMWDVIGHDFLQGVATQIADNDTDPIDTLAPDRAMDADFRAWFAHSRRLAMGPKMRRTMLMRIDERQRDSIRSAYQALETRTLVIRRSGIAVISPAERALADARLAGALVVEVPGRDSLLFGSGVEPILAAISEFVAGEIVLPPATRSVAAILFTDIGASTEIASAVGDQKWRSVLDKHDGLSEQIVTRHGGRLIKTTGDGVLALLPSAAAGLRAAEAIRAGLDDRHLCVRAAIHVGDVDARGDDISGLSVNIAARVMGLADPGEILVTDAAREASIGDDFDFEEHGSRSLKGIPGEWRLHKMRTRSPTARRDHTPDTSPEWNRPSETRA